MTLIRAVVRITLESMEIDERELLTLYYGADTDPQQAEEMGQLIQEWYAHIEAEIVYGGQPHYFYIMSAE